MPPRNPVDPMVLKLRNRQILELWRKHHLFCPHDFSATFVWFKIRHFSPSCSWSSTKNKQICFISKVDPSYITLHWIIKHYITGDMTTQWCWETRTTNPRDSRTDLWLVHPQSLKPYCSGWSCIASSDCLKPEECLGRCCWRLTHPWDHQTSFKNPEHQRVNIETKTWIVPKGNRTFWYSQLSTQLLNPMNSPVAAMSWSNTTAVRADEKQHGSSEHKGWFLRFEKSTSTPPSPTATSHKKPKPIIQLVFQLQEILDLDTVNHDKWTRPVSFFASCVNIPTKRGIIGFHSAFWTNLSPITSPLMWNQA